MSAPQSFEAWWVQYDAGGNFIGTTSAQKNDVRHIARAAWMAAQTAALALSGSRVVYVLDYIGSDDIPRRMIYATRAAADRAFQRSNKRAMVTVETVRTF